MARLYVASQRVVCALILFGIATFKGDNFVQDLNQEFSILAAFQILSPFCMYKTRSLLYGPYRRFFEAKLEAVKEERRRAKRVE